MFRERAGLQGYGDDFIAHYIFGTIYPTGLTRGVQLAIAIFVFAINTAVYSQVFPIRRFRRG